MLNLCPALIVIWEFLFVQPFIYKDCFVVDSTERSNWLSRSLYAAIGKSWALKTDLSLRHTSKSDIRVSPRECWALAKGVQRKSEHQFSENEEKVWRVTSSETNMAIQKWNPYTMTPGETKRVRKHAAGRMATRLVNKCNDECNRKCSHLNNNKFLLRFTQAGFPPKQHCCVDKKNQEPKPWSEARSVGMQVCLLGDCFLHYA